MKLFVWMLVLVAAALGLFVGLVALQPVAPPRPGPEPAPALTPPPDEPEEGGAKGPLIPPAIEGFRLKQLERVEPQFEGERFSVHATFEPAPGSPFADVVESVGVSVFQLTTPLAADHVLPLLALGEPADVALELDGEPYTVQAFVDGEAGLAGALWREGTRVYYVLVAGRPGAPGEALRDAALTVARAVLQQEQGKEKAQTETEAETKIPAPSMIETQTPSTKPEAKGESEDEGEEE